MTSFWSLTIKNLALPIFCKQCDRRLLTEENPGFCPDCWEQSPRIERPFCTICGEPHQGREGFGAQQNFPCAQCRECPPEHVRRIYAAAVYDGAIGEAIRLFKFSAKRRYAQALGELMAQFAVQEMDRDQYGRIVPVPLHRVRRRERGYNQSQLLAREIEPFFPNAVCANDLERVRPTRVQSRLASPAERRENVAGAFAPAESMEIDDHPVLLVDDVVTSGGTVNECARVLREAGAVHVDVLCTAIPVDSEFARDIA